ncbi:unnamed protein product [Diatraea saccharalis]|uniref:lysozyme n=1 Tax=Diatraea saccharalis TaxID=40085 RepID=A0A9N9QY80_9NEOP|nr:unnamed protein product [Diatraea saccharalis]
MLLTSGVCLVESESSRRTHVISRPNSNGSRDHGLFQINDRYWCNNSNKPGKDCNTTCAAIVCLQCEAKKLTRCQLVHELRKQKFPEDKLRDWVCLVESESSRRTHVISPPNSNGSRDHGLFQIYDGYWCNYSDVPELRTDDITKASNCAKKIYKRHGFDAWHGWIIKCKGKNLPVIRHC